MLKLCLFSKKIDLNFYCTWKGVNIKLNITVVFELLAHFLESFLGTKKTLQKVKTKPRRYAYKRYAYKKHISQPFSYFQNV